MNWRFLQEYYHLSHPLEHVYMTQKFGQNIVSFYKDLGMLGHNGIDYRAPIGTRTQAVINGLITVVRTDRTGGKELRYVTDPIEHDGGIYRLEFIYYHLDGWLAKVGDRVVRGQDIAITGNTGKYSTGPHLHHGMKPQWKVQDIWLKDYDNGYFGAIDHLPFINYDASMEEISNTYGLVDYDMIQLTEGYGGFAMYKKGKLYIDDLDKIVASVLAAKFGRRVPQVAWDAYPHVNLKNVPLEK